MLLLRIYGTIVSHNIKQRLVRCMSCKPRKFPPLQGCRQIMNYVIILRIDVAIGVSMMSNKGLDDACLASLEILHLSNIASGL